MRAVIVANGILNNSLSKLKDEDIVIAVDGGYRHCRNLNIRPVIVIGDLDSLTPEELGEIRTAGIPLSRHPVHKDQTDMELAMDHAIELGADSMLVYAALGARWDMTLSNIMILASPLLRRCHVRIFDGNQEICLLRDKEEKHFTGNIGDTLSLIPLNKDVKGVSTRGLKYRLDCEPLHLSSTRGISNVFCEKTASVYLEEGLLLCVVNHHL